MDWKERLARFLLKPQLEKINYVLEDLIDRYRYMPIVRENDPEQVIAALQEVDPQLYDYYLRQLRYNELGVELTEGNRLQAVNESRILYVRDVVTQTIINLWTDYAFGSAPQVVPIDTNARADWNEFWNARENDAVLGVRNIKSLSSTVLTDGEIFFVFFTSRQDGRITRIRTIPTEEIREIITMPGDSSTVLYYRREYRDAQGQVYTMYYKDWRATDDELDQANLPDDAILAHRVRGDMQIGTDVCILHAAHNRLGKSSRGYPLMTAGAAWSRAYRDFVQDRASVARAAASVVEKIRAKSGSRGIDLIRARMESSLVTSSGSAFDKNPPSTAGGMWIENEAVSRDWMSRPTNAGDAAVDGNALLAQAGLAGRVFPHYLGRGESFRLATTTAMERPTLEAFNGYQVWWISVFKEIAKIVLGFREKYGAVEYSTAEVDVQVEAIVLTDISQLGFFMQSINQSLIAGSLCVESAEAATIELMRVAMQTLNIQNVEPVVNPETKTYISRPGDEMNGDEPLTSGGTPETPPQSSGMEDGGFSASPF